MADHLTVSTVKDCFALVDLYQKSHVIQRVSHTSLQDDLYFSNLADKTFISQIVNAGLLPKATSYQNDSGGRSPVTPKTTYITIPKSSRTAYQQRAY